jgi:hypothetical protein
VTSDPTIIAVRAPLRCFQDFGMTSELLLRFEVNFVAVTLLARRTGIALAIDHLRRPNLAHGSGSPVTMMSVRPVRLAIWQTANGGLQSADQSDSGEWSSP